ncbi:MAG: hypothetical protein HY078_13555 [Elusimicrobia bacterium]|nr:hypothetical protein [Elusimicrobiota bacterium]
MRTVRRGVLLAAILGLAAPASRSAANPLGAGSDAMRRELTAIQIAAAELGQRSAATQTDPSGPDRDVSQLPEAFQRLIKFQNSHEAAAARVSAYRIGYEKVSERAARASGDWAVVLDVDDTVLDHQQYQINTEFRFAPDTWHRWVREARAPNVAGAKEFLDKVRRLPGAHVVFITDRNDSQNAPTIENLIKNGLYRRGDLVLTKSGAEDTKEIRRRCVEISADERCRAAGPMPILALFGDSLRDFVEVHERDLTPSRIETLRNDARWGQSWFVIVNPMYGQWERGYK